MWMVCPAIVYTAQTALQHLDIWSPNPTVVIVTFIPPPVLIGLTSSFKKLNVAEFPH